ncbi:glycoside hydrolase family 31 protein [Solirubrobacter phytolaccae]|uniref:Glycoside hydrolase family 31 protein n=1 Tax=Solirubrobacter phytolaccae TaxID=1404360 RepID=A0A9X3N957_9ACTN|nr:TIM-barrel domain-containing protein [Solirubrobacter phytolaccae]MDA0182093.1 glycoside hydrolase family 31 protein [Solirubrobacter phytolaccae]
MIAFTRVDSVEVTERGLLASLHGEQLRIEPVREDVVRIKLSRGGVFDDAPTHAVIADGGAAFTVEGNVLRTAALTVTLRLDPFGIDVHRSDGSPVLETTRAYATLNDAFELRRTCAPGDAIYGLGEKGGPGNRRGRSYTLWNTDILNPTAAAEFGGGGDDIEFDPYYVSIPFFYHHATGGRMSGSFVDNGYRAAYDFGEEIAIRFEGGQYTEYVFAGPSMPEILEAYTWLTGRAAPPPLWALGYHQCRWFDYMQDAVEALGARHRELGVPCDALWLDIEYMDGYRVFTWNTERFPDAPGMLARLDDAGFKVITIIDPGVKHEPGYAVFDEGLERDVLCRTEGGDVYVGEVWPGDTAFPDFATEEGRAWWGELNAAHVQSGLAGIWNDMNEPATGSIPPGRMRFDHGTQSHERFHNQYALLMAMGTVEGLRSAMPSLRTFVLSRAGSAGIQRYAANWMGDNQARWDHLWVSIPMANGFGVSGQPFVGADVGGFQGDSSGELFVRWMQYGALTPFCRNHSMMGSVDQYAWAWGEATLELAREAIRFRYRLLPYLYAAFLRACETGAPVQRPLVFDFQDDVTVRDLDDQYLLGPDLLVAPVTQPGMTARHVYLPAGDWHDWHTGERLEGGRWIVAATPMERIPLYARAGSVIPLWPEAPPSTAGYHPEELELRVFPGDGESFLHEDDGLTFDGGHLRTTFTLRGRELSAEVTGDGYPEFARRRFVLVCEGTRQTVENAGTGLRVTL